MARVVAIDAGEPEAEGLEAVRRVLDRGGVVGLPTDTLYGLSVNALDAAAVERIFAIKQRSAGQPLPLVVRDLEQVSELAENLPPLFFRLASAFWPGPLSLVVAAGPRIPAALHAGTGTVAVRQPDCRILLRLLELTGYPLASTSANRSGRRPALTAAEVEAELGDALELIVDGGPARSELPSTLVDLTGARARIVREGAIAAGRLAEFLG